MIDVKTERVRASETPLTENLFAPEIFVSEAAYFSLVPGLVTITFISYRMDHSVAPAIQKRVVTGRLVMPIGGASGLAEGLYDFLAKSGATPLPRPRPDQLQ
jgi:hypothetical protein